MLNMHNERSRHTSRTHFEQVPLDLVRAIAEPHIAEPELAEPELVEPAIADRAATSRELASVKTRAAENEMTDQENSLDLEYPAWQKLCQEALVELDPDKLKERVAAAEAAVFIRSQELARSSDSQAERQALRDATNSLRFLKRDVLKFPDWDPGRKI
jgi:DNA primase large subunit